MFWLAEVGCYILQNKINALATQFSAVCGHNQKYTVNRQINLIHGNLNHVHVTDGSGIGSPYV